MLERERVECLAERNPSFSAAAFPVLHYPKLNHWPVVAANDQYYPAQLTGCGLRTGQAQVRNSRADNPAKPPAKKNAMGAP